MTTIEIKKYLIKRQIVTLKDIAVHFRMETGAIEPILEMWERKGKLKKYKGNIGCQKGCYKCDPAILVTYEWMH